MFVQIVDTIRARFAERGFTEVFIDEGLEARNAQTNYGKGSSNRIVFVPSNPLEIIPPIMIGEGDAGRRQLLNVLFRYDVVIDGYDANHPQRELMHRRRCIDIFEAVVQEVQRAYHGAHNWTSLRWEDARKHGRHGAELVAVLTLNIPIFDVDWAKATPAPVPGQPKPVEE